MSYFKIHIFLNKTTPDDPQTCSGWLTKYLIKPVGGFFFWLCVCDSVDVSVPNRWVIFNDQKVCASEKPPKDMGYLYFYRRVADWGEARRLATEEEKRGPQHTHTHDLIHSHTPPTALRTLHQWQSCKYISQMTYKHCSINWCKCKKK